MKYILPIALIFICFNITSQTFWNRTEGPYGSYGGSNFAVDSSQKLYAVSIDLYTSTNNGNHWTKFVHPFEYIITIAFQTDSNVFISTDDGLYKSTNLGLNWINVLHPQFSPRIVSLLIDEMGNIFAATNGYGIYVSYNSGLNWIQKLEEEDIRSMARNSKGDLFAGGLGGQGGGLYRSTNSGINWVNIAFADTSVYSIAINSSDVIFICRESLIYKSVDGGNSWLPAHNGLLLWQDMKLFVDEDDNLYCGNGRGIYRSTNNGDSWFIAGDSLRGFEPNSFFQTTNGDVFIGSGGKAVYKTTNNGVNWLVKNTGISNSYIQSIYSFPSCIIAGANRNGIFYSTNSGTTWIESNIQNTGPLENFNEIAADSPGKIYAGIDNKLYVSSDSAKNWIYLSSPANCDINDIEIISDNIIMVSGNGCSLAKSTNGGLNWIYLPLSGNSAHIGKNYNGDLYFASYYSVYRSTNNGINWSTVAPFGPHEASCFSFDSQNNIYLGFENGILFSSNNGSNWLQIFSSNFYISNIIVTTNFIFTSVLDSRGGVYYSTNQGSNWINLNSGLEDIIITTFNKDSFGNLYCGTLRNGLFKGSEKVISINPESAYLPKQFRLYPNFPNPFNPVTTFKFDIPKESFVKLSIYDLLGREIDILINKESKAGQFEVKWDAANFSTGIYFCKLQTDKFSQTNKIVLVK